MGRHTARSSNHAGKSPKHYRNLHKHQKQKKKDMFYHVVSSASLSLAGRLSRNRGNSALSYQLFWANLTGVRRLQLNVRGKILPRYRLQHHDGYGAKLSAWPARLLGGGLPQIYQRRKISSIRDISNQCTAEQNFSCSQTDFVQYHTAGCTDSRDSNFYCLNN